MKAEFYRDYHIQATAVFEAEIGSWLPQVRIFPLNPRQRLIEFTGLATEATTASEAENYAIDLGKCWLDDRADYSLLPRERDMEALRVKNKKAKLR